MAHVTIIILIKISSSSSLLVSSIKNTKITMTTLCIVMHKLFDPMLVHVGVERASHRDSDTSRETLNEKERERERERERETDTHSFGSVCDTHMSE